MLGSYLLKTAVYRVAEFCKVVVVPAIKHVAFSKKIAIFSIVRYLTNAGHSPEAIAGFIPWRRSIFQVTEGELNAEAFAACQIVNEVDGDQAFDQRKWFCADGELIHYEGKTYAFSALWGRFTVRAMDQLIAAFPDALISYQAK